jgi:alpha-1,2-mannosyltransferase
VFALVAAAGVVGAMVGGFMDLWVYRYAGGAVLDGLPVYGPDDPVTGLPFTYPPFAALVLAPLSLVPAWLAAAAWTAGSMAALAAVLALVLRESGRPAPGWLVAALAAAAVALEPVWQNLAFGQVNLLLMLAVLVDVVRPERRWSGLLVGVAAGLKLTPLVFVVLLLLVRRPAAAGRAVVAFAVTVGLGLVLVPDATAYWGSRLLDPTRVGPPQFAGNQSLLGVQARLLDAVPSTPVWLAVAAPVGIALVVLAAAVWRSGDRVLGTCLAALAMLVASPMSWTHHWVWAAPLALVLWDRSRAVAAAWAVVFVVRPIWWPPDAESREYAWGPLDHLVGNAYVLAALVLAVWVAAVRLNKSMLRGQPPPCVRRPGGQAVRGRSALSPRARNV